MQPGRLFRGCEASVGRVRNIRPPRAPPTSLIELGHIDADSFGKVVRTTASRRSYPPLLCRRGSPRQQASSWSPPSAWWAPGAPSTPGTVPAAVAPPAAPRPRARRASGGATDNEATNANGSGKSPPAKGPAVMYNTNGVTTLSIQDVQQKNYCGEGRGVIACMLHGARSGPSAS